MFVHDEFTLQVSDKITIGIITLGKFDGFTPTFAFVSSAPERVCLYSRSSTSTDKEQAKVSDITLRPTLNFRDKVTALASGPILTDCKRDILCVGTTCSFLAYDVDRNSDVLYRDFEEPVSCICIGSLEGYEENILFVSGNTTIQGISTVSNEVFWSLTSSPAMCMISIKESFQENKKDVRLLVGCQEGELICFNKQSKESQKSESSSIIHLIQLAENITGYALEGGTFGVKKNGVILWKERKDVPVTALERFTSNQSSKDVMVGIGWKNGDLEIRNIEDGKVQYSDSAIQLTSVAGIFSYPFKDDNKNDLLVCYANGEVRGINRRANVEIKKKEDTPKAQNEEEIIDILEKRKISLMEDLKKYNGNDRSPFNLKENQSSLVPSDQQTILKSPDSVKSNFFSPRYSEEKDKILNEATEGHFKKRTKLEYHLECDFIQQTDGNTTWLINIRVPDPLSISMVLLTYDDTEDDSTLVKEEKTQPKFMQIPVIREKNNETKIRIVVFANSGKSQQIITIQHSMYIPRFFNYGQLPKISEKISLYSYVKLQFDTVYLDQITSWLRASFINFQEYYSNNKLAIEAHFHSRSYSIHLSIVCQQITSGGTMIEFKTEDYELAGELVQDLTRFLGVQTWQTWIHFPQQRKLLESSLDQLLSLDQSNQVVLSDMANITNTIKKMLLLAEDARMTGEFEIMSRYYHSIQAINSDLLRENIKRMGIQETMKEEANFIKTRIHHSSILHCMSEQSEIIRQSRELLKEKRFNELVKLIKLK